MTKRMPHLLGGFFALAVFIVPLLLCAQGRELERRDLVKICEFSSVKTDEGYAEKRKTWVAQTHRVRVSAPTKVSFEYDEVLGLAVFTLPERVLLADGAFLQVHGERTLRFEMPEVKAIDLAAGFLTQTIHFDLEVISVAHSDYDHELCEHHGAAVALQVQVVAAEIREAAGRTKGRFVTNLGSQIRMLKSLGVASYLGDSTPSVTVSALAWSESPVMKTAANDPSIETSRDMLTQQLQNQMFGCYVKGLSKNARLQGAVVVQIVPGNPSKSLVLMSSVADAGVKSCVLSKAQSLAGTLSGAPNGHWRATLIFKLNQRPG